MRALLPKIDVSAQGLCSFGTHSFMLLYYRTDCFI